jgi:hypothetical protein
MATPSQVSKIWAAGRELGKEREDVYDLVEQISGGRSITALTTEQAARVIDALIRAGARPAKRKPSGKRVPAGVTKLISGPVRDEIARWRSSLGGDWGRDEYFAGACRKVIRKDAPTTGAEGAKVIEMLKKRAEYNSGKAGE